jgi:putative membrane protein
MSQQQNQARPTRTATDSTRSSPQPKQTERPHPLTPLLRGWVVFVAIAVGAWREAVPQGNEESNLQRLLSLGVQWLLLAIFAIILLAAVAGFVSWYFTRFVIDDEELRIETGALAKRSRRIAFDRVQSVDVIQPLAARIFGLVELRIEVGGGGSGSKLRYLTRNQATHIRDYLLARAHGARVSFEGAGQLPEASKLGDLSAAEHPLVRLGPQKLIFGFVLSSEFLVLIAVALVLIIVSAVVGAPVVGLATVIPWAFGALSLISRRVLAQFNYTLTESVRGLRISRGLTNLTTQSLPIDRIQGVRISQSLLWRLTGWYRIDVDVLGYGTSSQRSESNTDVSSILLPVATWQQAQTALTRILPGTGPDLPSLAHSPKRARVIRPFDGWTLRYGWDDQVIVARHGFVTDSTAVVPHAKAQSVRVTRGPLQRRLRLASVYVDTPQGPVELAAKHLDRHSARELALTELDRARAARRQEQATTYGPDTSDDDAAILARFNIADTQPLGVGGESRVYPLDADRVLRVYRPGDDSAAELVDQLHRAYRVYEQYPIGLQLPMIAESGRVAGRFYSIDRRMGGVPLTRWLPTASTEQRRQVLGSYLQAATALSGLPIPAPGFARLFGQCPRRFDTLAELIADQLGGVPQRLDDPPDFLPAEIARVTDELRHRDCAPVLVHGDYGPGNVFATQIEGSMRVTGVADFSPHTLAADPLMDIAGAVTLLELENYDDAPADASWLGQQAVGMLASQMASADAQHWLDVYRRYYAIYFAPDPTVFNWAIGQLNR